VRKPKVVVIGGGSGIYVSLLALKQLPVEITAVVSVADSGGSSGRLRDEFGILPPGDVRRALLALANLSFDQIALRQLFEYRFENGLGLKGHSFGNLLLTALTDILGREDKAIEAAGKILKIGGKVYPVSLGKTTLCARLEDGTIIKGETNIDIRRVHPELKILDVFLDPPINIFSKTQQAVIDSDLVVLGPGDLYTSLIPNLLVRGASEAIEKSKGKLVFVCNLMTKHGETNGFAASDFVKEVKKYLGSASSKLRVVLVNNKFTIPSGVGKRYEEEGAFPVKIDKTNLKKVGVEVITRDLAVAGQLWRHDPEKLSQAIKSLLP